MSEAPPPAPQQPAYGAPPPAGGQPTNVLALISMIAGIVALVFTCCYGGGAIIGVVALILGYMGSNKAKEMGGIGAGQAKAGMICGGISVGLGIAVLLFFVVCGGLAAVSGGGQP